MIFAFYDGVKILWKYGKKPGYVCYSFWLGFISFKNNTKSIFGKEVCKNVNSY